jgi:hypothetical protein
VRHDDLLTREAATLFVLDARGRIVCTNDPPKSPGPRLFLGRSASSRVVRIRHDVPDDTAAAIEELVASEPPLDDPTSDMVHLDSYLELLGRQTPVEEFEPGLSYCVPEDFVYVHDVSLLRSGTPAGDRLLAVIADEGMPSDLVALGFAELWEPWCVAIHDGIVASVVETVRDAPAGVEAGVVTIPACRRHGYAAAATAGWASHPAVLDRTRFYSTHRTNIASQGVAARIGLQFVGSTLRVS